MNKQLIKVLEELNKITDSVILKYPITTAISEAADIRVILDVSKIEDKPFPEIGLSKNLSNYLSLYKLFGEDREVTYEGDVIKISSGDITSSYITDSTVLMDSYNIDIDQFSKTEAVPSVVEFDLLVEDIKKINSASSVFKDLNEVIIASIDGDVSVYLGATGKFNARNNNFKINKRVKSTKDFEVKIPVENFKRIPESEFKVSLKYNSAKDSYRVLLSSNTLEGFKIILSTKI